IFLLVLAVYPVEMEDVVNKEQYAAQVVSGAADGVVRKGTAMLTDSAVSMAAAAVEQRAVENYVALLEQDVVGLDV
ncbi:hypothetical protein BGW41_006538, partial [Actinomortierella wolfii]